MILRNSITLFYQAFLLFQEVANTEITIDMPCYHAILRVCAQARDVDRALDVFQRMTERDLIPTDNTWKLLLWAAANDPAVSEAIWKRGIAGKGDFYWTPSVKSFRAFLASFHAAENSKRIASIYHDLVYEGGNDEMGFDRLVLTDVELSQTVMTMFYEACKLHQSDHADAIARLPSLQSH